MLRRLVSQEGWRLGFIFQEKFEQCRKIRHWSSLWTMRRCWIRGGAKAHDSGRRETIKNLHHRMDKYHQTVRYLGPVVLHLASQGSSPIWGFHVWHCTVVHTPHSQQPNTQDKIEHHKICIERQSKLKNARLFAERYFSPHS